MEHQELPKLEEHFLTGSMWHIFRKGNPYEIIDTYETLRNIFGYDLFYVNFGFWTEGLTTEEPGRELTYVIGDALGLSTGQRVFEGGSGLGQAAIDNCLRYDLASVKGYNVCAPQVNFANALAKSYGLQDKIEHKLEDACQAVEQFSFGEIDHAYAQECIGHFPDPLQFLKGVYSALPNGGRMAITFVSSPNPPSKLLAMVQNFYFGCRARSGKEWESIMTDAGFKIVESRDITDMVFVPMFEFIRKRLREKPESFDFSWTMRSGMKILLSQSEKGVKNNTMGYHLVVGEKVSK